MTGVFNTAGAAALYKLAWLEKATAAADRENPIAERVNGILIDELLRPGYPDHASAKVAIAKAIQIYDKKRPTEV